ncbi:hypothetical protein ASD24_21785 [Paenibacillus sp. Root52]|uniref:F0F1-type ATP synthase assembly protein I n=1 Tax=Paenibacillus amylolyticus TaxID=1451 RepID=A0AAP5H6Q3_PAEAM|nr:MULTISPECIES: DUF5665 domain-containing protein [Paenibacillus]KQY93018.1 hypothetical protein ASD24_21785 [Paenibacillus sp. Root52]MCG7380298.1 DUF5665 domain-containing protein [Paenibacillus sp. ACRSA]MDR6725758.1 F0F1-type ATP synthase assembly protein I [Paenibacillus amylolyticus]
MSKVTINGNSPLSGDPPRQQYDTSEHPFELRHEVKKLNTRLDQIADSLEKAQIKDIIENYTNPKKRIITNFTAGMARGLGLTVGTFVVLGLLGYLLSQFVNMPIVGQYIADLLGYIEDYKN